MSKAMIRVYARLVIAGRKTIDDVPAYWKAEVREMLDCGAINGGTDSNPDDVNMRHEALQAAIVAYRAAVQIHK